MSTIERIGRVLLALSMLAMTGAVAVGVFFRYVLNKPLLWSDEIATTSLAWMTFIGGALLYGQRNGHLNLTFLTDRLDPARRRLVVLLADIVELALLAVVAIGGMVFIHFNRDAVTSALELPLWTIYGIVPVTALIAIAFLIRRMLYGPPPEPPDAAKLPGQEHG